MPRLSIFRPSTTSETYGGWNEPFDYCLRCYPSLQRVVRSFNVDRFNVDMDVEHPPYSDGEYRCEDCGRALTDADNDQPLHYDPLTRSYTR